ncbi:MAG: Maf-like protein [Planctomycetaceae bacterium]|nr:Maf-like protein [Planctomycetaceae bacterium]
MTLPAIVATLLRMNPMPRLILASRSVHRLQLLREAGYDVWAVPAEIDEPDLAVVGDLHAGLLHLAHLKARAVADHGHVGLILAADTVGCVNGRVFGKPRDAAQALSMLQAISGTTHQVLTGWCLLRTRDSLSLGGVERTTISMRPWTVAELADYLASGEWVGKSGAYGLKLPVDPFVTEIVGSASNVVGVPLERLQTVLAEFSTLHQ